MYVLWSAGIEQTVGWVAEWSCSGLQLRVRRFDSDPSLQSFFATGLREKLTRIYHAEYADVAELGRRNGLKPLSAPVETPDVEPLKFGEGWQARPMSFACC